MSSPIDRKALTRFEIRSRWLLLAEETFAAWEDCVSPVPLTGLLRAVAGISRYALMKNMILVISGFAVTAYSLTVAQDIYTDYKSVCMHKTNICLEVLNIPFLREVVNK